MFDDLTEPLLSMIALTLTVCLLLVSAMAAIGRDREGMRVGLAFAAAFAIICVLTQITPILGVVGLAVLYGTLFGWFAQSQGRPFAVWFAVSFLFGPIVAFLVYRLIIWLRGRGSTYGAADLAPA
jgi:hypothetical protein